MQKGLSSFSFFASAKNDSIFSSESLQIKRKRFSCGALFCTSRTMRRDRRGERSAEGSRIPQKDDIKGRGKPLPYGVDAFARFTPQKLFVSVLLFFHHGCYHT